MGFDEILGLTAEVALFYSKTNWMKYDKRKKKNACRGANTDFQRQSLDPKLAGQVAFYFEVFYFIL